MHPAVKDYVLQVEESHTISDTPRIVSGVVKTLPNLLDLKVQEHLDEFGVVTSNPYVVAPWETVPGHDNPLHIWPIAVKPLFETEFHLKFGKPVISNVIGTYTITQIFEAIWEQHECPLFGIAICGFRAEYGDGQLYDIYDARNYVYQKPAE